jgi:hypothetical protein
MLDVYCILYFFYLLGVFCIFAPCTYTIYVAFDPLIMYVAYSYHGIRARLDTVLQHLPTSLPGRRRCRRCRPSLRSAALLPPIGHVASDRPPSRLRCHSRPVLTSGRLLQIPIGIVRPHPPLAPFGLTCPGNRLRICSSARLLLRSSLAWLQRSPLAGCPLPSSE